MAPAKLRLTKPASASGSIKKEHRVTAQPQEQCMSSPASGPEDDEEQVSSPSRPRMSAWGAPGTSHNTNQARTTGVQRSLTTSMRLQNTGKGNTQTPHSTNETPSKVGKLQPGADKDNPVILSPTIGPNRRKPATPLDDIVRCGIQCRNDLKAKYQPFIRYMDVNASHHGHLMEPTTDETRIPILVKDFSLQNLRSHMNMSIRCAEWEILKDLEIAETKVFKTLSQSHLILPANADRIIKGTAIINDTIDAFCSLVSARLSLSPELKVFFGEGDIVDCVSMLCRLVATPDLPGLEERARLVLAVAPLQNMRANLFAWNKGLMDRNAQLKGLVERYVAGAAAGGAAAGATGAPVAGAPIAPNASATPASPATLSTEHTEKAITGIKRKAEDELEMFTAIKRNAEDEIEK